MLRKYWNRIPLDVREEIVATVGLLLFIFVIAGAYGVGNFHD